jgi:hypothetical protein
MGSYEFIGLIFTGLSVSILMIYYANVLTNTNKTQKQQLETRQAQLYLTFHETRRRKDIPETMVQNGIQR